MTPTPPVYHYYDFPSLGILSGPVQALCDLCDWHIKATNKMTDTLRYKVTTKGIIDETDLDTIEERLETDYEEHDKLSNMSCTAEDTMDSIYTKVITDSTLEPAYRCGRLFDASEPLIRQLCDWETEDPAYSLRLATRLSFRLQRYLLCIISAAVGKPEINQVVANVRRRIDDLLHTSVQERMDNDLRGAARDLLKELPELMANDARLRRLRMGGWCSRTISQLKELSEILYNSQ